MPEELTGHGDRDESADEQRDQEWTMFADDQSEQPMRTSGSSSIVARGNRCDGCSASEIRTDTSP